MYCVFITSRGAYYKFIGFTDELDRLVTQTRERTQAILEVLYAAFVDESNAKRFVDMINSATF